MLFQYPTHYRIESTYTAYINRLDMLILVSYPNSMIVTIIYFIAYYLYLSTGVQGERIMATQTRCHDTHVYGDPVHCGRWQHGDGRG